MGALSGGWKMRVSMAKVLLGNFDVLLMDEPTNHLDIESILWLEQYLKSVPSTLLMTSHDKDFMNRIVTKVLEIDGGDVVYKHFVHMGVAVGTPNGLVVPVVRDADQKSFAQIEKEIAELGLRARDGKLTMAEMQGGTFTISNGGVYGSLMSSPILNPPQSGILGMHKIQDRPVVVDGQIVIRPMMYLALSYDHRIVDGKGAVTFLVRVKEALEDPRRLLMDL